MAMSSKAGYGYFSNHGGKIADAFNEMYELTKSECVLDRKTQELIYIAYLSAIHADRGLKMHVLGLKEMGATRDEIAGAILLGMAPLGNRQAESYKIAMDTYDGVKEK